MPMTASSRIGVRSRSAAMSQAASSPATKAAGREGQPEDPGERDPGHDAWLSASPSKRPALETT
jgi:hypothetical protein